MGLFSFGKNKGKTDDDIEVELPTFSYMPIKMTSSLLRRQLEEERFKENGVEKEKMFEIL